MRICLPPIIAPFIEAMAASASSTVAKETKPKPLETPVSCRGWRELSGQAWRLRVGGFLGLGGRGSRSGCSVRGWTLSRVISARRRLGLGLGLGLGLALGLALGLGLGLGLGLAPCRG